MQGRKTGGRQKGTPNKRHELKDLLDAVFAKVDPVAKIIELLNCPKDRGTEVRMLVRLLEYAYGQPRQEVTGLGGGPVAVQIVTNLQMPPK